MTQLIGKILWFDHRDGIGIIEDNQGNEYYTDSSCMKMIPNRGQMVKFELKVINKVYVAINVKDF